MKKKVPSDKKIHNIARKKIQSSKKKKPATAWIQKVKIIKQNPSIYISAVAPSLKLSSSDE